MGEQRDGIVFKNVQSGLLNAYGMNPRIDFHDPMNQVLLAHASVEHIREGEQAFQSERLNTLESMVSPRTPQGLLNLLKTVKFACGAPAVDLSYGEILALAGDYYARVDDADTSYTGVRTGKLLTCGLLNASDVAKSLASARRHTTHESEQRESKAFKAELECAVVPHLESDLVKKRSDCGDTTEERAVSAANSLAALGRREIHEKRYYLLTLENWDHFHPHCFTRYSRLHRRAIEEAVRVGDAWFAASEQSVMLSEADLRTALTRLATALTINAFADHFLMDSFSAGHFYGERRAVMSDPDSRIELMLGRAIDPNLADPSITLPVALGDELHNIPLGDLAAASVAGSKHDGYSKGRRASCKTCPEEKLRYREFLAKGDWQAIEYASKSDADVMKAGRYDIYMLRKALRASIFEVLDAFLQCQAPGDEPIVVDCVGLQWVIHDRFNSCTCRDDVYNETISVPRQKNRKKPVTAPHTSMIA